MKRRTFIKNGSVIAVPGFLGGIPVSSVAKSSLSQFINGDTDRILVLVQLNGGNDGLNTFFPLDQFDNLAKARQNLIIPESELLPLTDTLSLHPNLTGFKSMYEDAKLNIIQGVAYPDQNRSHFRSLDIWNTGSGANEILTTGWAGRYFQNRFPDYPAAYPSEECPHPFAVTVGSTVSETCQGESGNYSLAIVDPENLNQLSSPVNNEVLDGCAVDNMDFLVTTIQQTNVYSTALNDIYDQGNNLSTKYDPNNNLATKLKTVARLISGGSQSRIYIVSLGGFDTHANQSVGDAPTQGQHAELLLELSEAICAFQDDLNLLGLEERVLGMTYSEFGRRIISNASLGTDHGTAAPLVIFGSCVNAGIIGENATISDNVQTNEGVAMQYDFRSAYGSVLIDWFGVLEEEVNTIFSHDFQYIPIANLCNTVSTTDPEVDPFQLKVMPNPFGQNFQIEFENDSDWVKISVFNAIGAEVKVVTNKKLSQGLHRMTVDLTGYPPGSYVVRLQNKLSQKTVRIVKGM